MNLEYLTNFTNGDEKLKRLIEKDIMRVFTLLEDLLKLPHVKIMDIEVAKIPSNVMDSS